MPICKDYKEVDALVFQEIKPGTVAHAPFSEEPVQDSKSDCSR